MQRSEKKRKEAKKILRLGALKWISMGPSMVVSPYWRWLFTLQVKCCTSGEPDLIKGLRPWPTYVKFKAVLFFGSKLLQFLQGTFRSLKEYCPNSFPLICTSIAWGTLVMHDRCVPICYSLLAHWLEMLWQCVHSKPDETFYVFCLIDICDHRESNSIVVEENYCSW